MRDLFHLATHIDWQPLSTCGLFRWRPDISTLLNILEEEEHKIDKLLSTYEIHNMVEN